MKKTIQRLKVFAVIGLLVVAGSIGLYVVGKEDTMSTNVMMYYGIWSPTCRKQLEHARTLLSTSTTTTNAVDSAPDTPPTEQALQSTPARCPLCGLGQLLLVEVLSNAVVL